MKHIILIGLSLFLYNINAQVGINTDSPHKNAMLHLKNSNEHDKDKSKGFILPNVQDITKLPLYSSAEPDLFKDDPTMEGMIMYQEDTNELLVYDGEKWVAQLLDIPSLGKKTRVKSTKEVMYACGINICGEANIPFYLKPDDDTTQYFDQLELHPNTFFTIKETGLYNISVGMEVSVNGVTLLPNVLLKVYKDDNMIMSKNTQAKVFIIGSDSRSQVNYTLSLFLKQGETLHFAASSPIDSGLTIGSETYIKSSDLTTVLFEKIY